MPKPAPQTRDWNAFENQMPPIGPTVSLNVSGKVTTTGTPKLTAAIPQGIVPTELILDLTIDAGESGSGQDSEPPARFHTRVPMGQYKTVMVRWEGTQLTTIAVQIAS